ncbi:MAG: (Fe-S)-binding protein [Euryarchaeota archaeon HGW-Euryarchaeota-1]|nr:MAG: (Fe-S)-binding protein [Euryarchaeota archaeon HGW-Euryarchaeota-1]
MSKNTEKVKKLLAEEPFVCARCGYCDAVCPTYATDKIESLSPRGKLQAIRMGILEKDIPEKYSKRIFQCVTCGACESVCHTDIPLVKLWMELRATMPKPDSLKQMTQMLEQKHNIANLPNEDRLRWTKRMGNVLHLKETADVLYFPGCVSSLFPASSAISQSFVQILDNAGIDFAILGADEWCCGFPQLVGGFPEDAKKQIEHNVDAINKKKVKILVTTCPACYRIFKEEYKELSDVEIKFEVMHSTQFIDKLIAEGKIKFGELKTKVTYHDPCDLGRNSGIYEPPRKIIKSIPAVEFVELPHNRDECVCCGSGGALGFTNPEMSDTISKRKCDEITETGAKILVTACQTCRKQIKAATRENKELKVMDITEFVLKAMKNE